MAKQLFRKVALERISSPEQLDQLITITTPLGWLALLAIAIFLAGITAWGIYGSIPTQVQGQGILLKKSGIVSVQALNPGQITKINIEVGDIVEEKQIIARLQQDSLLEQLRSSQFELKNLESSFAQQKKAQEEAAQIQLKKLQQDQINQNQYIKNLEIQIAAQNELKNQQQKLKNSYQKLIKEGVISQNKILEIENELIRIEQNINALKLDIERAKNQVNSIQLEIKNIQSRGTIDELSYSQNVEKLKLEIRTLSQEFAEKSQVLSPYKGRVVEIPRKEGDTVNPGTTICLLEKIGEDTQLEVIAYFSPFVGKQILKDMKAQIAPTIVKREEYGFLLGTITEVDKYPSTFATVLKTIQNDTLAQMLVSNAAPIKVTANLILDPNTVSGYKWSSRAGPPIQIDSGTICFVTVTVREQAPITLVVPLLKKYILGEGK